MCTTYKQSSALQNVHQCNVIMLYRNQFSVAILTVLLVIAGCVIFSKCSQSVRPETAGKVQISLHSNQGVQHSVLLNELTDEIESIGLAQRKGLGEYPQKVITKETDSIAFSYADELENLLIYARKRSGDLLFFTLNESENGSITFQSITSRTGQFDYSDDGSALVFSHKGNIWSIRTDGTHLLQLTSSGTDESPRWSPRSAHIAFTSKRDGNEEIYMMNADGHNQRNLTQHPAADKQPDWSPGGLKLAFASNRSGNEEVILLYPQSQRIRQLTNNSSDDRNPVWSPDGQQIAVSRTDWKGTSNLYVIGFNGRTIDQLTASKTGLPEDDVRVIWETENSILYTYAHGSDQKYIRIDMTDPEPATPEFMAFSALLKTISF